MKKTLLHFRNPDSTLDLNTQLSEFFSKGIVSGGAIVPVFPNSIPQVTVSPFKLIGSDGMVVIETSDYETITLNPNQSTVICFLSKYVYNDDPIIGFESIELSAYNALSESDKKDRTIFGLVITTASTSIPVVSLDFKDVIDPLSRQTLRGTVNSQSLLPATNNRIGDAYVVESGIPDPNNGLYVWKSASGWVNITDAISLSTILQEHRSNLLSNEVHLTDNEALAVAGTYGSPSGTNKFVTDTDPRIPTQSENNALIGLSQNTAIAPSLSNPYLTAAFNLAEPSERQLSYPSVDISAYLRLSSNNGPFYVGLDVGMSSAIQYFGVYDPLRNREYINSFGDGITITGVYYQPVSGPLTPLDPSTQTECANSNGFWTKDVYLSYTGLVDSSLKIRYGRQFNFQNINRALVLKPGPLDAAISAEALERLKEISGRLFDDPIKVGETNLELRKSQLDIRRYLNTTTSSDLVVPALAFPRLRQISDIASDFTADYGDLVEFSGLAAYTTYWSPLDVANFDTGYTEDLLNVAYVQYEVGTALPSISPGWTWYDDFGMAFRILAYNSVTRSILLFTQSRPINVNNSNGNQSKIYRSNNPRRLELLKDHATSAYREYFPIEDLEAIRDSFEELPPGGVQVGSYIPANNFSLIGTGALPNQGNPTGASRGRPVFYIKPFDTGLRPNKRLVLIGNWNSNQLEHPRQVHGEVSRGTCGIEFTGRLTSLTLYIKMETTMPYGFRVFVDGAYNHAASKFISSLELSLGVFPSNTLSSLRGDTEKIMMPLTFDKLGITDSAIHTVRVEITKAGTTPFALYGAEIFYTGAIEAAGKLFTSTDFVNTTVEDTITTPIPTSVNGKKIVRYFDRDLKIRQVANYSPAGVATTTANVVSGSLTFTNAVIALNCNVGDVLLFTTRNPASPDSSNFAYRRIVDVNKQTGLVTLNQSLSFNMPSGGFGRVEYVMSTPITVGSPASYHQQEYSRFYLSDWSNGLSRDINQLSTTSPDTRLTVLDDGMTALSVIDCKRVGIDIEGFSEAIRLETVTASMMLTGWSTGMDVVFTGSSGTTSTVWIEIDGQISYQISLPNDGMVRHSLFFDGSPQSHVVKIYNPSVAGVVAISQWIFHTLKNPAYQGTPIAEYEVPRNSTFDTVNFKDFAPTSLTSPLTVSHAGVRLFDITKYGASLFEGVAGTTGWSLNQDPIIAPLYFNYLFTNKTDAVIEIEFVGTHFEFYYLASNDAGKALISIDDLFASSLNYTYIYGTGYDPSTGILDSYSASIKVMRRLVVSGLTMGKHKFTLKNTSSKNALSVGYMLYPVMAAENPGMGVVQRRAADDTQINRTHFESYRDVRQFLSMLPDQVGITSVAAADIVAADLRVGYLDSAFVMSDGSGTALQCTLGNSGTQTYLDLSFSWVPSINPGTTAGDLDVYVDGLAIPRKVQGATQDAWYEEDLVVAGRIKFWTLLGTTPLSIEVRRKAGTLDLSNYNLARITALNGVLVGNASQVSAGIADYSSLQTAINAVLAGAKITILQNFTVTEAVTINKRLTIMGQGYDTKITGLVTFTSACTFATIKNLYASQFVLQAGSVGNQITDCYWDTNPLDSNALGSNRITGMLTV